MRTSRIKAKLARNEPALCTSLSLADPAVFELTSIMGFDGIWIDLEHHGYSVETAGQLMRAARVGTADILARPAKGEFMRMGRLLEMGAQGIMYPRCDSPEEAAEVVRWAKFAPEGVRGFDGGNPDGLYTLTSLKDYIVRANRETFIVIQLEHQQAIDQAEAIAATPGVDVLMLGPGDFSILSGFPGELDHPLMIRAMEKVSAAARNTGKHWACITPNIERAQRALQMGARLLIHFSDIAALKIALENVQRQFSPLGFNFDNYRNGVANSEIKEGAAPQPPRGPVFLRKPAGQERLV